MMGTIHLIRIPDKAARHQAIAKFLDVRESWVSFPNHVWGITSEHLRQLQEAQPPIAFEWVSKTQPDGQANTTVQA